MKITRKELQKLIAEELNIQESVLLEAPIVGQEQEGDYTKDPDGYQGEEIRRSLYHMSQQAQQLHDLLAGDENLEPWVQTSITKAAGNLEKAFKAIMYDKGPGQGKA